MVIIAGSNDTARNEAQRAVDKIRETVTKYSEQQIILLEIPKRYDLENWSCVNTETKKTNSIYKTICDENSNVTLVEVSSAHRQFHTRHGQHLNKMGKQWLAQKIYQTASGILRDTAHVTSSEPEIYLVNESPSDMPAEERTGQKPITKPVENSEVIETSTPAESSILGRTISQAAQPTTAQHESQVEKGGTSGRIQENDQ